ncbi:hypothetical protein PsYK624_030680 [Phanerochaete sordida]|uniref:DUF1990 domain-containing protein n=1 Tax=Phanerochaete sordida TaxID=48140 RepID=A0A9P3G3I8_9APHY|nr:hypothetical protein PsYK624_030680 [Phanerochaete sordida]
MPRLRTLVIGTGLAAIPALYIRSRVLSLERDYPSLSPESTSTVELRTPRAPGLRTAYTDVYATRIPLAALRRSLQVGDERAPLEELWPRAFFQTRTMRLEAKIAGLGAEGDLGAQGFTVGQRLVAGVMRVLRAPGPGTPLIVEWEMPPHVVRFFETIAAWGYPWRMMKGGRHEWSVGPMTTLSGEGEDMVEVRFAAAHDYRVVEGEKEPGKIIPQWVMRAHRAYARYLLDEAAKEIRQTKV